MDKMAWESLSEEMLLSQDQSEDMDCADDWEAGTASAKALGLEVLLGFEKEKRGQHSLRSALHYVLQASVIM